MRVLVACEYSGIVREAFARLGHDAWSCDLLPTEQPGQHIQGNVRDVLNDGWDMVIAHPPCTDLSSSGAAWFEAKRASGQQQRAIDFFMLFARLPCERVAIENPVGIMSSRWREPTQIVHPWQFGHMEQKATCLWLKNLPKLTPTCNVHREMMCLPRNQRERLHFLPPSPTRWMERSRTFQGIADAMAQQWGTDAGLHADMPLFAARSDVHLLADPIRVGAAQ